MRSLAAALDAMGEPVYHREPPDGFPDHASAWVNPGLLLSRMSFGLRLALGQMRGVRVDLAALTNGIEPESADAALRAYGAILLPGRDLGPTTDVLEQMVRAQDVAVRVDSAAQAAAPSGPGSGAEAGLWRDGRRWRPHGPRHDGLRQHGLRDGPRARGLARPRSQPRPPGAAREARRPAGPPRRGRGPPRRAQRRRGRQRHGRPRRRGGTTILTTTSSRKRTPASISAPAPAPSSASSSAPPPSSASRRLRSRPARGLGGPASGDPLPCHDHATRFPLLLRSRPRRDQPRRRAHVPREGGAGRAGPRPARAAQDARLRLPARRDGRPRRRAAPRRPVPRTAPPPPRAAPQRQRRPHRPRQRLRHAPRDGASGGAVPAEPGRHRPRRRLAHRLAEPLRRAGLHGDRRGRRAAHPLGLAQPRQRHARPRGARHARSAPSPSRPRCPSRSRATPPPSRSRGWRTSASSRPA